MQSDNSCMQCWGHGWLKCLCEWLYQAKYTEPHHPQQNPAKLCAIKYLKQNSHILCQCTGAPEETWLHACQYLADVHNITSDEILSWITPWQK